MLTLRDAGCDKLEQNVNFLLSVLQHIYTLGRYAYLLPKRYCDARYLTDRFLSDPIHALDFSSTNLARTGGRLNSIGSSIGCDISNTFDHMRSSDFSLKQNPIKNFSLFCVHTIAATIELYAYCWH